MTARFKKGHHQVSLVNEDEDELQNSDTAVLINEGPSEDEMKEHGENYEEELTGLSPNVTVKKLRWKFWKKQRRYIVSHSSDPQGRELSICGRKIKLCGINSWRAVFLVLFVFSVAVALSVIVSKLAAEPPAIAPGAATKQQGTGKHGA